MKYKIDLHVHTKFSGDTNSDPEETVLHAIKLNLYGMAFTEHYSFEASEHAEMLREKYTGKIMIFRGVEFSSADGHCLVFGVNTDKLSIKHAPMESVVRVVSEHGGVVIPTHPFRGNNSIGDKIDSVKGFTAVEGCNGYSLHAQNVKAIEKAKALHLPFTGGSDAHESHEVGSCYTEFNDKATYENFIDMLKKGQYKGVDKRKISKAWVL